MDVGGFKATEWYLGLEACRIWGVLALHKQARMSRLSRSNIFSPGLTACSAVRGFLGLTQPTQVFVLS